MFAERRDPCGYLWLCFANYLWSLILLVSIKYVGIVLRADNDGEGGILALLALAFPEKGRKAGVNAATVMTALGVFGAALLYGDGVITPAISVLSAVEGLKTVSPVLDKIIVPLTICILVALFAIQRFGTGAVGGMFGRVMLLWFLSLGSRRRSFCVAHRVWHWKIALYHCLVRAARTGGNLILCLQCPETRSWRLAADRDWRNLVLRDDDLEDRTRTYPKAIAIHDAVRSICRIDRTFGFACRRKQAPLCSRHSRFLASSAVGTPIALLNNLKHNRVIHERNILLTFVTERVPYWVDGRPRLEITAMNDRFLRVIAHFGFMEIPTIEKIAEAASRSKF